MRNNELKYTSLTVEDILAQVYDRFLTTPDGETNHKFDNFRESAIAQTLIEIFAGTVDINNYYIQRRAEECYFDTAQLKSSVISLSRMFGYVMNRKEPSRANLRMIIEGDIEDNQVQIPYYSKFSFEGNPYVLVNTMTYRLSDEAYNTMNDDSVLTIDSDSFDNPIEIVQGSIKEKVFNGATNAQVNSPFQIYKIEDTSFSNVYGEKDFFYNDVTQVYVGENKTEDTRFSIDRRSLLNWDTINNASTLTEPNNVCVIRTATDGNVEILFGDAEPNTQNSIVDQQATGGFARKGAITRKDNIYVQYLSCDGKSTNKYGVIGDKVDFSGKIFNSSGKDITSKISFELVSNVYGGADDESIDSIKYSSPKIYYSLDRLVTKGDYVAYMKSLNSPVNVQNAVAWGEQEERDLAYKFALAKMFNVALFTLTGSLYDLDAQPHVPKTGEQFEEVVLDINYDPFEFQTQGYFNVYVIQEMVNQLKRYTSLTTFYELDGTNFDDIATGSDPADRLESIANHIKTQIYTAYGESATQAPLTFEYTSDSKNYNSNIKTTGTVMVEGLDSISGLSGNAYLTELGVKIDLALRDFKDVRGNKTDNENFDKQAFFGRWGIPNEPDAVIKWEAFDENNNNTGQNINGAVYQYRVRFNESADNSEDVSPCYITEFVEDDASLASIIGLSGAEVFPVTMTSDVNEMNGKITQVVDDLTSRSQTNVKNIYVSPIIHQFNIVGDVYVKPLYDKETVKNEITNDLYEWLDINADFNQPVYLSNIVEIFERNLGVIHANIRLEPVDITAGVNNSENSYYEADYIKNDVYKKYTTTTTTVSIDTDTNIQTSRSDTRNLIAEEINNALNAYLQPNATNSTANEEWERNMYTTYRSSGGGGRIDLTTGRSLGGGGGFTDDETKNTLESYKYSLVNSISERSFYVDFAGPLYARFKQLSEEYRCGGTNPTCEYTTEEGNTVINGENPNYGLFIGLPENINNDYRSDVVRATVVKSDFALIMEQIHKDLSYAIMNNLLDTNGNIDAEYNSDSIFVRGGYTLGSEIVQVLTDSTYKDDSGRNVPFLNFRYK